MPKLEQHPDGQALTPVERFLVGIAPLHTAQMQRDAAEAQARAAAQEARTARVVELRHRLTLNQKEAAELLGISDESFVRNVRPRLQTVDAGRAVFPVADLERFVAEHAREVRFDGR